jgi:hypothetical protein
VSAICLLLERSAEFVLVAVSTQHKHFDRDRLFENRKKLCIVSIHFAARRADICTSVKQTKAAIIDRHGRLDQIDAGNILCGLMTDVKKRP